LICFALDSTLPGSPGGGAREALLLRSECALGPSGVAELSLAEGTCQRSGKDGSALLTSSKVMSPVPRALASAAHLKHLKHLKHHCRRFIPRLVKRKKIGGPLFGIDLVPGLAPGAGGAPPRSPALPPLEQTNNPKNLGDA
jgi:hypothetical protein